MNENTTTAAATTFRDTEVSQTFWRALATHCPQLEAIHFNTDIQRRALVPIDLFPQVRRWGLHGQIVLEPFLWSAMTIHRIENRITFLEFLGDDWYQHDNDATAGRTRDKLLRQFLCSSPTLLHLLAGEGKLSTEVLWEGETDREPTMIWACRRLKTLSIRLFFGDNIGPYSWTTRVFGYLSRVCPKLQELSLEVEEVLALEMGLCLLTRLQDLRRLELRTGYLRGSRYLDPLDKRDFAWMRGDHPASTTTSTTTTKKAMSVPRKILSSLIPSFLSRRTKSRCDLCSAYKRSLERIRTKVLYHPRWGAFLYDPSKVETDRIKMQQEQWSHDYRSDYSLPRPMVDGLKDFKYSGTYLDIEACLQAQLFRHQQRQHYTTSQQPSGRHHHHPATAGEKARWTSEKMMTLSATACTATAPCTTFDPRSSCSQPWPEMEKVQLTCFSSVSRGMKRYICRGCRSLRRQRPEIEFSHSER